MNLWDQYKKVLSDLFFTNPCTSEIWADWIGKNGSRLIATNHYPQHFIKSRDVLIWDNKSCIYNNIFYPKTGSNLPCFGMDLMGFFDKKVTIVFDFQHPVENYLFSHPELPKSKQNYRFFEPENHFSKNTYLAKCSMSEVNDHLQMFTKYLVKYKEMIEYEKPIGMDQNVYSDFDKYMKRLDPVGGYLSNKFGKERTQKLIKQFLFSYG